MDILEKQKLLEKAGSFDVCGGANGSVYDANTPSGTCPLLKTLISTECSHDCKYCFNCSNKGGKRVEQEPEELAKVFMSLLRQGRVEGLFLSSGVKRGYPDSVTEKMIDAVQIVRHKYNFKGYVHFKVLPGTSYELVKQASVLATRMSINIESPSKSRMAELSSNKDYKIDILRRQAWIRKLHPNQTTQMIVGADDATDKEVLKMADWEYESFELKRIYYSAFTPIDGTPLGLRDGERIERTNHLYNTDFLVRKYGYKMKEFFDVMDDKEMLPNEDPKIAIAKKEFEKPVEINGVGFSELLRVPGIGPKSAGKLDCLMKSGKRFRKALDLKKEGVIVNRASQFIKIDGSYQRRLGDFVG